MMKTPHKLFISLLNNLFSTIPRLRVALVDQGTKATAERDLGSVLSPSFPALLSLFPWTCLSIGINYSSTSWHERRDRPDDEEDGGVGDGGRDGGEGRCTGMGRGWEETGRGEQRHSKRPCYC